MQGRKAQIATQYLTQIQPRTLMRQTEQTLLHAQLFLCLSAQLLY